jgi:ATP-dependent Lon protease
MEILQLAGYIEEEKLAIAKNYLIPRQIAENGLDSGTIAFTDDAIRETIRSYTREAGVRQLERELGSICRGVATRVAEGFKEKITIDKESIREYLGPQKFFNEIALRTSLPGVATGLAWTPFGGDILFVEATKMSGDGRLQLTGQLGDVMKEARKPPESCQITGGIAWHQPRNLPEKRSAHPYPCRRHPQRRAQRGNHPFRRYSLTSYRTTNQQGCSHDRRD